MGSFSLKNDNFDEEKNIANENNKGDVFKNFRYINENEKSGEEVYRRYTNRVTLIIVSAVLFIIIVNVILFITFSSSSQSILEIPNNVDFKEYVDSNLKKDQNIYNLLSKSSPSKTKPKIIKNNDTINKKKFGEILELQKEKILPQNKKKDDFIDFKSIRGLDINDNFDNSKSVSAKILNIDQNNNSNTSKIYRLNVGVFLTHKLANEYINTLKEKYKKYLQTIPHYIIPVQFKNRIVYKVLIGDFKRTENANNISTKLDDIGVNNGLEEF